MRNLSNEYKIFPNPANDFLTIQMGTFVEGTQISIFDISGKNILTQNLTETNQQISISNLSAGVYFYAIHAANSVITATEKLYIVR